MKRLLDSYNGVTEYFVKDGDKTIIETVQDVAPILEDNQKQKNIESGNWKGDLHHVASIPLVVWQQWWREFGSDPFAKENRKKLIARLNNMDYQKLRTKSGKI